MIEFRQQLGYLQIKTNNEPAQARCLFIAFSFSFIQPLPIQLIQRELSAQLHVRALVVTEADGGVSKLNKNIPGYLSKSSTTASRVASAA
jgi:hypothetical protein